MHSSSSSSSNNTTTFNVQSLTSMGGAQSAFHVPSTSPNGMNNNNNNSNSNSNQTVMIASFPLNQSQQAQCHTSSGPDAMIQLNSNQSINRYYFDTSNNNSQALNANYGQSNANAETAQTLGPCQICGDRATGKHYGAISCDGCKGFFRRTIRKNHHYVCRFRRSCVIDKDKRNSCRFCRFQNCINAGMRKEAVQNERDRISNGKRKRDQAPMVEESNSQLNLITEAENVASHLACQIRSTVITNGASSTAAMHDQHEGHSNNLASPINNGVEQFTTSKLASINDLSDAIKQQLLLLVEWAKALPPFGELDVNDQVALLRAYSAPHLLLGVARRSMPFKDVLLLSNDACIPRSHYSQIHDVNHVTIKVMDELVEPMRDLMLNDTEYGCLKALLFFNPNAQGLSNKMKVKNTRQSFLETLQDYVAKQYETRNRVRFGNILLLSPPLQALSQQFVEDLQLVNLFGVCRFDKLLEELLLSTSEPFSGAFSDDGITKVANRMAGGLLNVVTNTESDSSSDFVYNNHLDAKREHLESNLL